MSAAEKTSEPNSLPEVTAALEKLAVRLEAKALKNETLRNGGRPNLTLVQGGRSG